MTQKANKSKKTILVLPRWYPNKTDIQLGIFIQRQLTLMKDDFNFHVVYSQAISDLKTNFETVSSTENGFSEHVIYFKSSSGLFRKLSNFRRYKKAQKLGMNEVKAKIDLCHVHVPYRSAMPALRLLKKEKTPFMITEHWSGHLNGEYLQKNGLDKMLYKRVLKKASKISTVSEALRRAFKKNTGFDSEVIPNYIERKGDLNATEKADKIQLLSVGDFHNGIKNFTGILIAFKMALLNHPNLQLTLVGGGPDFDYIKKTADGLDFPEGTLTFTGRQNHDFVLEAMQKCDFYICNSRHETFGMTVAEALYCGKPVISTRCGGPEEFVTPDNGILINPAPENYDNGEELAEAILTMIDSYKSYNPVEVSAGIDRLFGKEAVRELWLGFYGG